MGEQRGRVNLGPSCPRIFFKHWCPRPLASLGLAHLLLTLMGGMEKEADRQLVGVAVVCGVGWRRLGSGPISLHLSALGMWLEVMVTLEATASRMRAVYSAIHHLNCELELWGPAGVGVHNYTRDHNWGCHLGPLNAPQARGGVVSPCGCAGYISVQVCLCV